MTTQANDPDSKAVFEFDNTRLILQALQALSLSAKQSLRVAMTAGGITFRCEDDGKVCQSSVFFPCGFFIGYEMTGTRRTFSLTMSTFLEALKVFTALKDVVVRATQHAERLVLETAQDDAQSTSTVCVYAHITVMAPGSFRDLMDNWQTPVTEFMTAAGILKEAVEDLEWPQGAIQVLVKQSPFSVALSGESATGSLEIALPAETIRNAVAQGGAIRFSYAYKFMKAALVGLAASRATSADVSSRVSVDANGLLKVVHMLGSAAGPAGTQDVAAQQTQAMSTAVILTYLIQPLFEDEVLVPA